MLRLNLIGTILKDWTKNVLDNGTVEYVIRVSVVEQYTDRENKPAQTSNMVVLKLWRKAENAVNFESNLKVGVGVYANCDMPTAEFGKNPTTNAMYGYFFSRQVRQIVFLSAPAKEQFLTLQALGGITADANVKELSNDKERRAINFSIACSERIGNEKDENCYPKQNTVFVNCGMFRAVDKTAVAGYLLKGQKVYAEGKPVVRVGTDAGGNGRAYFNAEITNVEFVGSRNAANAPALSAPTDPREADFYAQPAEYQNNSTAQQYEDLPF